MAGAPFAGILRTEGFISEYPINIDPDYQREHVWTQRQQELFLGHLMEGGNVMPLIVNEGPGGDLNPAELVDGKQRVTACIKWAKGEIGALLSDGNYLFVRQLDTEGRTICRNRIGLQYGMVRLTRKECLELYLKFNRGGTVHTEEEIERVRQLLQLERGKEAKIDVGGHKYPADALKHPENYK
jgi:hypothetical protein